MLYCPNCKATMDEDDRFCPKCATDVTAPKLRPQAAGTPMMSRQIEMEASRGRVAQTRVPVVEGGRKYVGLYRVAELMIRSAAIIRLISLVIGVLGGISIGILLRADLKMAVPLALIVTGGIALIGWIVYLMQTVLGELIYVVMDVEESLSRRSS